MKTIKQFFWLVKPFWGRRAALFCWFLLLLSLGLTLSSVWFNIRMNQWNGDFYNALQKLDGAALYQLIKFFVVLVSGLILVVVLGTYFRQKLAIRWREGMTEQILSRWLSPQSRHYLLRLTAREPDNPDQRIAEDVRLLVESTLSLLITFLHSLLTLISFAAILWQLSGSILLSVAGTDWRIDGYMFWACIGYTLVGIALTQLIGGPLRKLNMEKQQREADYRAALITRRQHGDAIAGQRGELQDKQQLLARFARVAANWNQLIRCERNLSFYTVGYQQVTALAPILFALPKFLAGELMLGGLMQLRQAFTSVATSLGWFIFAYKEIAAWQATVTRLYHFVRLLENDAVSDVTETRQSPVRLDVCADILLPDNRPLLENFSLSLHAGEFAIISGRSGLGKSTLLRALSGHWPYYRGNISREQDVMWVPQSLYLPSGTLKSLLAYPHAAAQFTPEAYREVLDATGLAALIPQLDTDADWRQRLSGGEQQRLLIARLLLSQPKLMLLDEITSALDDDNAVRMIRLLRQRLPDSTLLLVSHQRFLQQEADRVIALSAPAATCTSGVRYAL